MPPSGLRRLNQEGMGTLQSEPVRAGGTASLRRLWDANRESADAWNGLGWARFRGGFLSGAYEAFEKAVVLVENHPGANNGLGYLLFSRREYDLAERYWKKVTASAPASWYGLSHLYLIQGRYEDALPLARKVAAQQPSDEIAKRALAAAESKKLDDDLRALIEPSLSSVQSEESRRAWVLLNQGMAQESRELFEKAIEKNPNEFGAHNGLGFCLLNMGEIELGEAAFSGLSRSGGRCRGTAEWTRALFAGRGRNRRSHRALEANGRQRPATQRGNVWSRFRLSRKGRLRTRLALFGVVSRGRSR